MDQLRAVTYSRYRKIVHTSFGVAKIPAFLTFIIHSTVLHLGNACDCLCYKRLIIPWSRLHYLLIGYAVAFFLLIATVVRVLRLHKKQQQQSSHDEVDEHQIESTNIWQLKAFLDGISFL